IAHVLSLICRPEYFISMFPFYTAPPSIEINTLSLHDALPILGGLRLHLDGKAVHEEPVPVAGGRPLLQEVLEGEKLRPRMVEDRSEEHTSELQSRENLVCRLLLEKK